MIDESLCWLIANDKIEEAKKIIKKACKWNKKNYREVMEDIGWGDLVDGDVKPPVKTDPLKAKQFDDENRKSFIERKEANMNDFFTQISGMDYSSGEQQSGDFHNGNTVHESFIGTEMVSKHTEINNDNQDAGDDKEEMKVMKYTVLDIFKHKRILIVSLILWYTW
jgi:hypothetical protein